MRVRLLPRDSEVGWTPYVWLVYLGAVVVGPIVGHASAAGWLALSASLAIFLPLYFRGYWLAGRRLLAVAVAITALGLACTPVNHAGGVFLLHLRRRLRRRGRAWSARTGSDPGGRGDRRDRPGRGACFSDSPVYQWV